MEADSPLTKRSLHTACHTACQVVPWLELAYDQGQDLNATQYGDDDGIPRIFKSTSMQPSMATMTGYLEYSSLTLGMITVPKVCLFLSFSSTSYGDCCCLT